METKTVKVLYKYVDGAHFFIGGDEWTAGLCVAKSSIDQAFTAVDEQLSVLFKENHNIEVQYTSSVEADALSEWVKESVKPVHDKIFPIPEALLSWVKKNNLVAA